MQYYSLNGHSPKVNFKEATIAGQAPDKGLYYPAQLPSVSTALISKTESYSNEAIAYEVIRPYTGDDIPEAVLRRIVEETVNFDIPLVQVNESMSSLELYHGPTLAFKDIGARFMSRCLGYFAKDTKGKITVLVATSGDTGGAVANGFYKVDGVEVIILYPSGKVSSVQEKQLTTLGENIFALEINGSFDDCQAMVKQAFADAELQNRLSLTSANSINVARWLPQQFYYFYLWKQWKDKTNAPVVCVPSGNFGNICAGLLAARTGLPLTRFIAACNANDVVPEFFKHGKYLPKKAVPTLSNAMDVGDPSNFIRILQLFMDDSALLSNTLHAVSIDDDTTKATIKKVLDQYSYLTDPHGAVAYAALEQYLDHHPGSKGVFLETAHPVKFYDVIEPVTGQAVPVPAAVAEQVKKEKVSVRMEADADALRTFLLERS